MLGTGGEPQANGAPGRQVQREASRTQILRRVRALIARADHQNTPPTEAAAARTKVEKLVVKHGLQDLVWPATVSAPVAAEPTIVHLMSGFTPAGGAKWRAVCRCGYRTTPRTERDRALRALTVDHQLDTPECVLCGAIYDQAGWMAVRDGFLQVLQDPATGDEFAVCRDLTGCLARSREA